MIVLVTGGRDYAHAWRVFEALSKIADQFGVHNLCIVQGGSTGADAHAREWSEREGVCCVTFHAQWRKLTDAAGPIRNRWMFKYMDVDMVIAFPGGTGTAGCVREAKRAKVPEVIEVE